ncbi:MAG: PTS sugar transporter subunit IIA [Treponema sp.]|nr:PTS sugar transporter subunit IIA [Treponema sp.]
MISETVTGLGDLLERGGIHRGLQGNSVRGVLENFIKTITLPKTITEQVLLEAVMEREALMTTGIGKGIALPHPRNPVITGEEDQFTALGFLEHSMDWKALDGKPVDTLILIVSASAQFHLKTLSVVSFFCQQDEFTRLLEERAPEETIIRYIKNTEKEWK